MEVDAQKNNMPPPKQEGTKPISVGIKSNKKFNFHLFYKCFNTKNTPDIQQCFNTIKEAQNAFKNYIDSRPLL